MGVLHNLRLVFDVILVARLALDVGGVTIKSLLYELVFVGSRISMDSMSNKDGGDSGKA